MVEAKKNERANALKEVKRLCKEFGFTAGMLKGSLAEGRGEKWVGFNAMHFVIQLVVLIKESCEMIVSHF